MKFTLYSLIFGAAVIVVHSYCDLQPYDPRSGQQPYDPRSGQQPYDPRSGRQPYDPRSGRQPYDPRSGQQPYDPRSGRQPYDPRSGRQPYDPRSGRQPYDPRSGRQPYDPRSGRQPYDPRSGRQPYDPRSGRQPYDPRSGRQPYDPRSGRQPYDPRSGRQPYDPRSGRQPYDPRSGRQPYDPRSGGRPQRPQSGLQPNQRGTSNNNIDYCNVKTCSSPKLHTLCRFSEKSTGPNCGKVESSEMTDAEINEVLNKHNELRAKIARGDERRGNPGPQPAATNLRPLKWNPELARIAQAWANQCDDHHDECHDTQDGEVGQNIAYKSNTLPYNIVLSDLVESWYNEVEDVNNREVKAYEGVGFISHYIQLAWAATTEVGCGVIRFNDRIWSKGFNRTQLVCNYAPKGNWLREPVYQTR